MTKYSNFLSPCLICFKEIKINDDHLRCRQCPILIHLKCFLNYDYLRIHLKEITSHTALNKQITCKYSFICLQCNNHYEGIPSEEKKCFLCSYNIGILFRVFDTKNKIYLAHPSCLKRSPSVTYSENELHYIYNNIDNYINRGYCKLCKNYLNIECKNCFKFYKHSECEFGIKKNCKYCKQKKIEPNPINEKSKKSAKLLISLINSVKNKDELNAFSKENENIYIDNLIGFEKEKEKFAKDPEIDIFQDGNKILIGNGLYFYDNKENTKTISLDKIIEKIYKNFYFSLEDFKNDFNKLFIKYLSTRCLSKIAIKYVLNISAFLNKELSNNKFMSDFLDNRMEELKPLIESNDYKIECSKWPLIPTSFRQYYNINSYVSPFPEGSLKIIKLESGLQSTKEKKHKNYTNNEQTYICIESFENDLVTEVLSTLKKPEPCEIHCDCFYLEKLGNFSYESSTWVSRCKNRVNKIECDEKSHNGKECKNMAIRKGQEKKLDIDVKETLCWGLDVYSRNIIAYVLDFNSNEKNQDFVEKGLIKAINYQKECGYDIKQALRFICDKENTENKKMMFTKEDRKLSKRLIKILEIPTFQDIIKVHNKGMGLICIKETGIIKNELVIEYYGELYPPWRWFEKQEFIRKYMKLNHEKDVLLDFYNIMLERHKNDPMGYSITFIDPIHKGNFSSRLSHSCDPNCGTVTTVSEGRYFIGMYALKDIKYGEELTFDYCSVTEDLNEAKKAICLCGSKICRGNYLEFSKSKEGANRIETLHCFLKRNEIVLRSCYEEITENDENLLYNFNVKTAILDNCPKWLKKWICFILTFIEDEKILIKSEISQHNNNETIKFNTIMIANNAENRLQNIAIAVDKIKYILSKMDEPKKSEPPFVLLEKEKIISFFWSNITYSPKLNENKEYLSILNDLYQILNSYKQLEEIKRCISILIQLNDDIQRKFEQKEYDIILLMIRLICLKLSSILGMKSMKNSTDNNFLQGLNYQALSDILYFYAFTHTYFIINEYPKVLSEAISVRKCEVSNVELYNKNNKNSVENDAENVVEGESFLYKSTYIWGQLTGWFNHNMNLEAKLNNDKKGTLIYPHFSSFYQKPLTYPFQTKLSCKIDRARKEFLEHLKKNPNCNWSQGLSNFKWIFKSNKNYCGTIFFEANYNKSKLFPEFLQEILNKIDSPFNEQFKLLKKVELSLTEFSEQEINDILINYFEKYEKTFEMNEKKYSNSNSKKNEIKENSKIIKKILSESKLKLNLDNLLNDTIEEGKTDKNENIWKIDQINLEKSNEIVEINSDDELLGKPIKKIKI